MIFIRKYWLDLLAAAAAVAFVFLMVEMDDDDVIIWSFIFWPAFSLLWLMFRLSPVIRRITARSWREQIVLTFLPIALYLWNCLKKPLVAASAPVLTSGIGILILLMHSSDELVWMLVFLFLHAGSHALLIPGLALLMRQMCRSREGGAGLWLFVIGWCVFAFGAAEGSFFLLLQWESEISEEAAQLILTSWGIAVVLIGCSWGWKAWRWTCQEYRRFE